MFDILSVSAEYGAYISIIKLVVFLVFFLLWLPLINWVHSDSQAVKTDSLLWTSLMTATGAGALFVMLLLPLFLISVIIYVIGIGAMLMAYIVHRNSRVADFEKMLTAAHIKSLFVNEDKKIEKASLGFTLVTANGNEVPFPKPKSPEAYGFIMVCELIDDAIWRRAEQINLMPLQQEYQVTYVIDGLTEKQGEREKEEIDYFTVFIKQLCDLDVNEKRKPQRGSFTSEREDKKLSWEVTTAGSTAGEQIKIRKSQSYGAIKLEELGLSNDQLEKAKGLRGVKGEVFLTTGPKKSGTTTTFYALLRNHDPFLNSINTLENHIDGELENITQNSYTMTDSGSVPYSRKFQTMLRRGPDIVGITDVNDKQTAYLAAKAAKDNKTIHATMEASSVLQAVSKWIKLVEEQDLAFDSLGGVINQRLVRKLCDECKQGYKPNAELLRKFNLPADKIKVLYRPGEVEYDKHGKPIVCEHCQGTGYYGRTGVFETIFLDEKLREAVKKSKNIQDIANHFRRAGMLYMQEQAIRKAAAGVTSINEIIRELTPKKKPANKNKQKPK